MAGTTRYLRSTSHQSADLDALVAVLNQLATDLETFRTEWNTKQGGTPITLSEVIAYRLLGVSIPTTPSGVAGIAVTSGNSQSATVATSAANPLVVTVTDAAGAVVANSPVTWAVTGDGSITSSSLTNASGQAQATLTLGTLAGSYTVTATASNGSSTTFSATGTAGAAATIAAASPTTQSGTTSTAVSSIPSVFVSDAYGNPKSGVAVTFAVTAGGGAIVGGSQNTGSDGVATCTSWTLGASAGLNTATATSAGLSGSPVTFNANASASLPTQIVVQSGGAQTGITAGSASAAITFRVKDGGGTGVQGVTVSFSEVGSGTLSVSSAESNASGDVSVTLTTHTTVETATVAGEFYDASGNLQLASTTVASTFGAAAKLVIVTQPASNGSSGTVLPGQPVIAIADANGNTVTTATNTVTCAVQSGNASITANSTQAAVSGLATFTTLTLTDSDGGANVLRFSSGGLTVVDSNGVTLAPPVPVAVQWQEPITGAAAGAVLPAFTAHIVDASNTLVPGAANSVTLSVSGGASLGGTTTVQAVSGVATFSDITVTPAGSYTFTGASTGLTSDTSASVTISAASSTYPNLPAGYTSVVWSPCGAVPTTSYAQISGSTGFFIKESGTITSQTDATAPLTPSTVWRTRYGTSHAQGTAPCNVGCWSNSNYSSPTQYSKVYLSFRMMIGTTNGFLNHPAGTKMGFIAYAENPATARNQMYLLWKGAGGSSATNMTASRFVVNQQSNGAGANRTINPVGGDIVTTGVYHHIEVVAETNSGAGVADGILKMWVDGTQTINVSNMVYKYTSNTRGFFWYAWNPTWGGNTGGVTHAGSTDDILMDDFSIYAVP